MILPIATLINDRLVELGLNNHALAARLGYTNTNKGSRRLQNLMEGALTGHQELLSRLPTALEIPAEDVARAVQATEAAKEQGYRDAFIPHAVIVTERSVPSQITICVVMRGDRALHIALDVAQLRATFARQAQAELNLRTDGGRREILFFGAAQGFVVNYKWCRAVRFDLEGRALELLPKARQTGTSMLAIKGRSATLPRRPSL